MDEPLFLTGLDPLQADLLTLCRTMMPDGKGFVNARDLLCAFSGSLGLDEIDAEEECEALAAGAAPLAGDPEGSIGHAYWTLIRMGAPWRCRYPLLDLRGMIGDRHDEIPFGPESVELRLSRHAHLLLPRNRPPFLPLSLLNGVELRDDAEVPPHNLEELWLAMEHVRQDPRIPLRDLMEILPGPDFACGAIAGGVSDIHTLYAEGEAELALRGEIRIEIEGGRTRVAAVSLPPGVLIKTVLEQIRALRREAAFPLYDLSNKSEGEEVRIVLDASPTLSAARLREILYQETDLERRVRFRLPSVDVGDENGDGALIAVLKQAADACTVAWERKDGKASDFTPFLRDVLEYGGYKSRLHPLIDSRRTAIRRIP